MKADEMKIFRLEDRILFEAAAAAEVVEAIQNDPGSDTADTGNKKQNTETALNVPFENNVSPAIPPAADPAETADVDAQVNALIEGVIPSTSANAAGELVVVNGTVNDLDSILEQLDGKYDVLVLEDGSGLEQLTAYLDETQAEYTAIHLLSHGNDGKLLINSDVIDNQNFDASQWQSIGEHLSGNGEILLYGCDVAANADGQKLIDRISDASGATVAASCDATGVSGDWDLEYSSGIITSQTLEIREYNWDLATVSNLTDLTTQLNQATASGGTVMITIDSDITINSQIWLDFDQTTDLTIKGIGDATLNFKTGSNFNFENYDVTVQITLSDLTFDGNNCETMAIFAEGIDLLQVEDCKFSNFKTNGVIEVYGDSTNKLLVKNSTFADNTDMRDGGAIETQGVNVEITQSKFVRNFAKQDGGALYIYDGTEVTLSGNSFSWNTSERDGGAITIEALEDVQKANIDNCTFYANSATGLGGAIRFWGKTYASITNSTFTGNTAADAGNAVYNGEGTLKIDNSLLVSNGSIDIWQATSGGSTTVTCSMITAIDPNSGSISADGQVDAAYTAQNIFDVKTTLDDLYDAGNQTLALNPFHAAAWSGADAADDAVDQLGNLRNSINTTLEISGMYSIGAVTAKAGVTIVQNNYEENCTGAPITPAADTLTAYFAYGTANETPINKQLTPVQTSSSSPLPIISGGSYTIDPTGTTITGVDDSQAEYNYVSGTLLVKGNLKIQEHHITKTYGEDISAADLQSQYTIELDDPGTVAVGDNITLTVTVNWAVTGLSYSTSGKIKHDTYIGALTVDSFTVTSGGTDMMSYFTWDTSTASNITVNQRALQISIDGSRFQKEYDGSAATETTDQNTSITNKLIEDDVDVKGVFLYDNKNAGSNKTVTLSSMTLTGADAANYKLVDDSVSATGAVITPKKITVTANDATKVYGDVDGKLTYFADGLVGTDTLSGELSRVEGENAGSYEIGLGELKNSNYDIAFTGAKFVITPKNITVTANDATKVYGDVDGELTYFADGLVGTDTLSGKLSRVEGENAGSYEIGLGELAKNNYNYNIEFTGAEFVIVQRELTVSIDGSWFNKIYDGTILTETDDQNTSITNKLIEDDVDVKGVFLYDNKNAGSNKTITLSSMTLTGADAANYKLVDDSVSAGGAVITARELDITTDINTSKIYDGTTDVTATTVIKNLVAGDDVQLQAQWQYNSPDVLTAEQISNTGWSISGSDAENYVLPEAKTNISGKIEQRPVNVEFDTDAPYVYNGTDQSNTVSATYTDVNGNKIALDLAWNAPFINSGTYTVTADFAVTDPNYQLVNNTVEITMSRELASTPDYADGVSDPGASSTLPSIQGDILSSPEAGAFGNFYTMNYAELVATREKIKEIDYRGTVMDELYGTDSLHNRTFSLKVNIDTLKHKPFEVDTPAKEISPCLMEKSSINNPEAMIRNEELNIENEGSGGDDHKLLNEQGESLSEHYEMLYIDDFEAEFFNLPGMISADAGKAENMKSELELLLDELVKNV